MNPVNELDFWQGRVELAISIVPLDRVLMFTEVFKEDLTILPDEGKMNLNL